jgi:ACS family hexuronate transporter-like MFS transporter
MTDPRGRRWLILGFLVIAAVLNYADRQVIAVLKPDIQRELGWTDVDYGTLASLFQFSAAVGYIFAGWIVDRAGVRLANPLGVASWSLAAMSHALARTIPQFGAARMALGATEALGTPMAIKTVSTLFDEKERSAAIGVANASTNIGAILAPLVLAPLAAVTGWRSAFLFLGALGLVWSAAWLLTVRRLPPTALEGTKATEARTPVLPLLRSRATLAICGAKAMSDQVWWLLLFWAPDFFHRVFHLKTAELGAPLAIVYAFAAVGSLFGGWASGALVRRGLSAVRARLFLISAASVVAMTTLAALHASSANIAAVLIGVTLAAHQTFSVNLFSLIGDVTPKERVGAVTSLSALCGNLAGMGIVYLAGRLLAGGAGYGPLITIAGLSYLVGAAWLWRLLPKAMRAA